MRRFLLAAALLASTVGYEVMHPPANLAVARGILRRVPQAIGPWQGTELEFGEAVSEQLQADDVLIRRYEDGARSVWLCLVFHQNKRYGAHDPHLCYESQGFVLERDRRARIEDGSPGGLEVNTFVAERKNRRRVVWYWWTTQGLATPDVGAFRSRMALTGALDNRSWGSFVRVESVAGDGDMAAATERVREFASSLARELPAVFAPVADSAATRP
jgi:EpsI family protein